MKRFSMLFTSCLLVATLFGLFSYGVAFAAPVAHSIANTTCASAPSDGNCTGQDPIAQGCSGDAFTVTAGTYYIKDDRGVTIGEADLRYSTTCQSNWAKLIQYNSSCYVLGSVWVIRPAGQYPYAKELYNATFSGCGGSGYTDMVYAPGTVQAQSCGSIDGFFGGGCGPLV